MSRHRSSGARTVGATGSRSARLLAGILRGDSGFGTEMVMREAEHRWLAYLFKLRLPLTLRI